MYLKFLFYYTQTSNASCPKKKSEVTPAMFIFIFSTCVCSSVKKKSPIDLVWKTNPINTITSTTNT